MFNFNSLLDAGNYEDRKIGRVEPEDNNGCGVSTAYTSDEGYETALLDANGVHPVERYKSAASAQKGHKRWVKRAKTVRKVTELFWSDMSDQNEVITIKRVKDVS